MKNLFERSKLSRFLAYADPRYSLAARLGWAHVLISLIAALAASWWFAQVSRYQLEDRAGNALRQYATQISNEIDAHLNTQQRLLMTYSTALADLTEGERRLRSGQLLQTFRRDLPEFDWIILVNSAAEVIALDGDRDARQAIRTEPWFIEGMRALWADDLSWRRYDQPLSNPSSGFLTMSAPVRDAAGNINGVLAAQLSLTWARSLGTELSDSLRARASVETLVLNQSGLVLFGPAQLLGTRIAGQPSAEIGEAMRALRVARDGGLIRREVAPAGYSINHWPDGVNYVAGWALSDGYAGFPGLGWAVWVREPESVAFAFARTQQRRILTLILLAGLIIVVVGLSVTRRLTQELSNIAQSADEIRAGHRTQLAVSTRNDEAARIGHSLQGLLDNLQARTHSLERLNLELDARVNARSREVERLADENRHAAVVRERLRWAREMHDTLAQSLMSLLTQIRLMRRLALSDPDSLPEEISRAEAAALAGLQEARQAILQLRHQAVRDMGIGLALEQLASRVSERCGFIIRTEIDPELAGLADSRAEAIFRISEEALRNVERHAHARTVGLSLQLMPASRAAESDTAKSDVANSDAAESDAAKIVLDVSDDGIGFDGHRSQEPGHFGIEGIREQAELIGGRVTIESVAGEGTRVTVSLLL